jgi:hypothetical protein
MSIVIFDCGMRHVESYAGRFVVDRPVLFVRFRSHRSGLRIKRMPHLHFSTRQVTFFGAIPVQIDNDRVNTFLSTKIHTERKVNNILGGLDQTKKPQVRRL